MTLLVFIIPILEVYTFKPHNVIQPFFIFECLIIVVLAHIRYLSPPTLIAIVIIMKVTTKVQSVILIMVFAGCHNHY